MGISSRVLPLAANGLLIALSLATLNVAAGSDEAAALVDAQRRMKDVSTQLDRAQGNAARAERALRQAQDNLEEAQREVERRRAKVEEATKAKGKADEQLAEAQGQYKAARDVMEKLYDAQQKQ